ncbi:MAG: hypothetical protein LBB36_06825 [Fibromonadaceae bacterium]|jgi:hypothetical protein|nr:hypothetical protein [Fibromonadaceae bacterium]
MRKSSWNKVIWVAIQNLKDLFEQKPEYIEREYVSIDEIFLACEEELYVLQAPRREIELRLFALALYCDKTYNWDFFSSITFSRFAGALDFFHFEHAVKALIEESSPTLVIFWVIFRLSFVNYLPRNVYLPLETELRGRVLNFLH